MIWNQDELKAAIEALPFRLDVRSTPAEYYVAVGLAVHLRGRAESLYLRGFVTAMHGIPAHDLVEVERVELTNGSPEGGLTSRDPDMIDLYAAVRKLLVARGAEIVPTIETYF